jgi:hypothetical protein
MGSLLVGARLRIIFGLIATQREMKRNNETFSNELTAKQPVLFSALNHLPPKGKTTSIVSFDDLQRPCLCFLRSLVIT